MSAMQVRILEQLPEGVEVGVQPCACGGCRPTATAFREDPMYERHDPELAQGPCCCDRFFVIGPEAERRAQRKAEERRGPEAYAFEHQQIDLPWGATTTAIVANFRE